MKRIESPEEVDRIASGGPVVIGFFSDFSEKARKTFPVFERFCRKHDDIPCLVVDPRAVPGVHKRFGVTVVPTVILVRNGVVLRKAAGVQSGDYYETALLGSGPEASGDGGPAGHRVIVYTGPHCPWCARVKDYLRANKVPFVEIDVSRDRSAADALVRRTGQTGVPQLDIDGRFVVGFDKARIDALLGLGRAAA